MTHLNLSATLTVNMLQVKRWTLKVD
jgi:hypothetical protein